MLLIGQAALLVALVSSAWATLAGALGGATGSVRLSRSAARALVASLLLLLLASGGLAYAILTNDFVVRYVADYSSRNQPLAYKISALWAGQGGSLMFWALLLAGFGAALVAFSRRAASELLPWTYAVIGGSLLFFTAVTAFAANPFEQFPAVETPPDGVGMNPLLQNFWMLIHPPTLYVGYVGCVVPFAFGMAALMSGRLDPGWVRAIRRWSLFTFAFLTLGIWLGAYWAYIELGWGGFWAWDPVENASLMPWLVLTAFVHSIVVQDRRGMLKIWNLSLIIVTFLLSVYGTFLTRSGIIQSVHAFSKSSIGNWFIAFLAVAGLLAIGLLLRRLKALRPDAAIESLLSRESTFLFGNLVLLGLTLMVFLLTMWPVISELSGGVQVTFKPEKFTAVTRPFFLLLIVLMGLSPLAPWRKPRPGQIRQSVAAPVSVAVGGFVALLALNWSALRSWPGGLSDNPIAWAVLYFSAAIFITAAVLVDILRMLRARSSAGEAPAGRSLLRLALTHRRRFGGYFSHLAVVLMVLGIVGAGAYEKHAVFESVKPGESVTLDGYRIQYQGYDVVNRPEYDGVKVRLDVVRPGAAKPRFVSPERRVYGRTRQPSTEVAILSTVVPADFRLRRIGEDIYFIPAAVDLNANTATIEVIVHPLINWLWLGGVLLLVGTLVAFWPDRAEDAAAFAATPAVAPGATR